MIKIDLLLEWLKKDAEYFAGQLKEERELAESTEVNVAVEFYHKGKIAALESVLRVAYKPYLDLLVRIADEQEKGAEENGKTL